MTTLANGEQAVGRPRNLQIDEALRHAAEQLLRTNGYDGLSIEAICRSAGCTRRTFFLRHHSVDDLVLDVLKRRFGENTITSVEDLQADLLTMQRNEIAMLRDPLMSLSIAGILQAMRTNENLRLRYIHEFVLPRRRSIAALIDGAKARGHVSTSEYDLDALCDLLVGPILARMLLFGPDTLSEKMADLTVAAVLAAIGYRPTSSGSGQENRTA